MQGNWIATVGLVVSATVLTLCALASLVWLLRTVRQAFTRAPRVDALGAVSTRAHFEPWALPLAALLLTSYLVLTIFSQIRAISDVQQIGSQPSWEEWRLAVHNIMKRDQPLEQRLADCARLHAPPPDGNPAVRLRRDQEMAQLLGKYEGVRKLLEKRFGIRDEFFGTGFANPISEEDYALARIHEFIIPNYEAKEPSVWTWKMPTDDPRLSGTVGALLQARAVRAQDAAFADTFRSVIEPRLKATDRKQPMAIRFAQFPEKFYSGKLGRPDATRVFACNLAEVWDMSIRDAAKATGFLAKHNTDDTFFVWLVIPTRDDEIVPASWQHVFKNLPAWLESK